jgi:hypothetical protein
MLKRDATIASITTALNSQLMGVLPYQTCADFDLLARQLSVN